MPTATVRGTWDAEEARAQVEHVALEEAQLRVVAGLFFAKIFVPVWVSRP